jgi:hypothetical protein
MKSKMEKKARDEVKMRRPRPMSQVKKIEEMDLKT